jgi:hypothetical protein
MINTALPASPAGLMATRTGPALWTRLPSSGWQVRFWADTDGRTLLDVADPDGTLACRLASARQAGPSIDADWTRCAPGAAEDSQCWALAVGRAPAGLSNVSFARRTSTALRDRMTLPPQAPSGLWVVHNGLWAAAATGCYTHVRLTAQSITLLQPLSLVAEEGQCGLPYLPHTGTENVRLSLRARMSLRLWRHRVA